MYSIAQLLRNLIDNPPTKKEIQEERMWAEWNKSNQLYHDHENSYEDPDDNSRGLVRGNK